MKKLLFFCCLCLFSFNVNGQNGELTLEKGVSAHREIDQIYAQFSQAYQTLDAEKVANLYTENAAYLVPNEEIMQGRNGIRASFTSFFDYVKNEKRTMTISFQIFQRRAERNMAYDVGIYTIRQMKDGRQIGESQGKFVVVAVREKSGKWFFQVDGYSNLMPEKKN